MSKVARYDQGSILAPMFSLMVCIGLRGRRQKERERRRGGEGEGERKRKREGGMRFSPPPPPPLSPLFVLATKIKYVFMKRLSKPWCTSFTFSIGLSLGKLIPPHVQTPFQRNLLTSSGILRREISGVQLPTPELLEE